MLKCLGDVDRSLQHGQWMQICEQTNKSAVCQYQYCCVSVRETYARYCQCQGTKRDVLNVYSPHEKLQPKSTVVSSRQELARFQGRRCTLKFAGLTFHQSQILNRKLGPYAMWYMDQNPF